MAWSSNNNNRSSSKCNDVRECAIVAFIWDWTWPTVGKRANSFSPKHIKAEVKRKPLFKMCLNWKQWREFDKCEYWDAASSGALRFELQWYYNCRQWMFQGKLNIILQQQQPDWLRGPRNRGGMDEESVGGGKLSFSFYMGLNFRAWGICKRCFWTEIPLVSSN